MCSRPSRSCAFKSVLTRSYSGCDPYLSQKSNRPGGNMTLRRFIIERDIPSVGSMKREELRGAAAKSNEVNQNLGSDIVTEIRTMIDPTTAQAV
jgi:hypothetical protein